MPFCSLQLFKFTPSSFYSAQCFFRLTQESRNCLNLRSTTQLFARTAHTKFDVSPPVTLLSNLLKVVEFSTFRPGTLAAEAAGRCLGSSVCRRPWRRRWLRSGHRLWSLRLSTGGVVFRRSWAPLVTTTVVSVVSASSRCFFGRVFSVSFRHGLTMIGFKLGRFFRLNGTTGSDSSDSIEAESCFLVLV